MQLPSLQSAALRQAAASYIRRGAAPQPMAATAHASERDPANPVDSVQISLLARARAEAPEITGMGKEPAPVPASRRIDVIA